MDYRWLPGSIAPSGSSTTAGERQRSVRGTVECGDATTISWSTHGGFRMLSDTMREWMWVFLGAVGAPVVTWLVVRFWQEGRR